MWFAIVAPGGNRTRRAIPYLLAGGGLMRHDDRVIPNFTVYDWAFTGGLGLRIALNERWSIALKGRLGWEAYARLNATVDYRFGR